MTDVVDEACRFIGRHEPLHLARGTAAGEDGAGDRFSATLGVLLSVFAAHGESDPDRDVWSVTVTHAKLFCWNGF